MDLKTQYYALCLVRDGASKSVTITDRMALVNDRLVKYTAADDSYEITDKGRDKISRKGK